MKRYRVEEKRDKRFDPLVLCGTICGYIILLMVIVAFFIKTIPPLSSENGIGQWIIIGILSYKECLIPGLCVPIVAVFLVGIPIGLLSSTIMGRGVARIGNFLAICLIDILESLPKYPTILLGILLIPKYYEHRLLWVMIILGILNSSKISRIIKAKIDSLERREYIEAAKSFGISKIRLALVHILVYNCRAVVITQIFLQMIDVILIEIGYAYISSLTRWGICSTPTFGNMLVFAKNNYNSTLLYSTLLVVAFNILTFLNLAQIWEKRFTRRIEYELI